MTHLPNEILCMVCIQLWHQRDLNTLFNCACSGKRLATIAMMNLYREAPRLNDRDSDEVIPTHDYLGRETHGYAMGFSQEPRRAGLWRTILLSSLGKTLYPYSQYIRTLDLGDLNELLTRFEFKPGKSRDFFQGEVAPFKVHRILPTPCHYELEASNVSGALDAVESTYRIGEAITKQTPLLEELTGQVLSKEQSRWIPGLPRLTHLELCHGTASKENGTLIRLHCPSFKRLHLSQWHPNGSNCDLSDQGQDLAAFLEELRPQSIEKFTTCNSHYFGPLVFQALNCHGESLTDLRLDICDQSRLPIPNLWLLKGCTNLVTLSLIALEPHNADLQVTRKMFAWLKKCTKLRILTFIGFCKPDWIAPILSEKSILLTSLEYEYSDMRHAETLFQALANQSSLQSLQLTGYTRPCPVEADVLMNSISKLVNLTHLHLERVCESMVDRHIVQLAGSLPKLEVWSGSAFGLTDAIWGGVASLKSLQGLHLFGLVRFTRDGILDFIEKLGPGNKGLILSGMYAWDLSWDDRALIRETMVKKVQGRFEFMEALVTE